MSERFTSLAEKIPALLPRCADLRCLLGFDGTVDIICRVVRERFGAGTDFDPFERIRDFGEHILKADGRSALIEIFRQREKIGGNSPIMANALAATGLGIDCIGAFGHPEIHPAYHDFAERVRVHSTAEPAITHALEFDNGKVMLAALSSYENINTETIRETLGEHVMRKLIGQSGLFCLLNWSCLPGMDSIFDWLLDDILPALPAADHSRIFFFDLADPSPRIAELTKALERIARFANHGRCVLGMNFNETLLVCNALGIDQPGHTPDSLCNALAAIRSKLGIHMAMGHSMEFVACADNSGTASVDGIITPKPVITTGAGDHLNAGFCLGLLLELDLPDALALGVLFPGFYVREARPPTLSELPDFIARLQSNPSNV
ncbi:MAG TPA: PfkB family carbohydrate kinase [Luteolibacter sp.]|nr:PfkB family carbohydrate kinase [Luteolibacter sp.]